MRATSSLRRYGTHLKADDGVELACLGADHDDRRPVAGGPNGPAHVDTRHFGQHEVEQDEVGSDGAELVERFGTVIGHLHPEPFALQAYDQCVDERRLSTAPEEEAQVRWGFLRRAHVAAGGAWPS
jgi:hypothetical protein